MPDVRTDSPSIDQPVGKSYNDAGEVSCVSAPVRVSSTRRDWGLVCETFVALTFGPSLQMSICDPRVVRRPIQGVTVRASVWIVGQKVSLRAIGHGSFPPLEELRAARDGEAGQELRAVWTEIESVRTHLGGRQRAWNTNVTA